MADEIGQTGQSRARKRSWKVRFIEYLKINANVSRACKEVGRSRSAVYDARQKDAEFAAEWDEAIEICVDRVEEVYMNRMLNGTTRSVFYKGAECGHIREYDNSLLVTWLKAKRPEVWNRPNFDAEEMAKALSRAGEKSK